MTYNFKSLRGSEEVLNGFKKNVTDGSAPNNDQRDSVNGTSLHIRSDDPDDIPSFVSRDCARV